MLGLLAISNLKVRILGFLLLFKSKSVNLFKFIGVDIFVRGHPFMTSTRRGEGQAQVDACGRGKGVQPHVDVHTEN